MTDKKRIAVLGSTGSIGENALKVIEHLAETLEVVGVAANTQVQQLARQAGVHGCQRAVIANTDLLPELQELIPEGCSASSGTEGLVEMVTAPEVDMVLCGIVGTSGLIPVLEAIKAGKNIALASKEVLVMAGELVMAEAQQAGVSILPVDSEHSAIFQCLEGKDPTDVSKLILTASGGPFRNYQTPELQQVDYQEALSHPTWDMGPKVTIDSATLMNKALEIIEAHWLFGVSSDQIEVVIHPQSIIHSLVEFIDGTMLAQLGTPDMRFPIQYALTYPQKHPGSLEPLDLSKLADLTFETPDTKRFPSLDFAYSALKQGGTMPAVMNAANEAAVERFRTGKIKFTDIWNIIERVMSLHNSLDQPSLDAILTADLEAREAATEIKL